jgi:hypothetical protein
LTFDAFRQAQFERRKVKRAYFLGNLAALPRKGTCVTTDGRGASADTTFGGAVSFFGFLVIFCDPRPFAMIFLL